MRFPLPRIPKSHPDWDAATFGGIWYTLERSMHRLSISSLVGTQRYVSDDFMLRPDQPIFVTKVNGVFYIRDGHHRVTRSLALGRKTIVAEVTEAPTEA